jgi:hypothetical protein
MTTYEEISMKNTYINLIGELDIIHENLQHAKQNTGNPLFKDRIEQIKKSVIKLMNEVKEIEKKRLQYPSNPLKPKQKKKVVHHQAPKGRNAHRRSSLFNPQGGFKPTSSYHVKGYED